MLVVVIVVVAMTMFRGGFSDTVRVTVLSPRAGLVMYPDAKVQMRGVTVGQVSSIDSLPDGKASIQLAMNPSALHKIPENSTVQIASSTVFGAKFVEFLPPDAPSPEPMYSGQVFDSRSVTVELNTVFEQLTSVLTEIEPEKLNETLGVISTALSGRGDQVGQMLVDFDEFLAAVEPSLPALQRELAVAPDVMRTYADAAPDLVTTVDNSTTLSQTIVEEQHNLDAFLASVIGLADVGQRVLQTNGGLLESTLAVLVPTLELSNEYNEALTCSMEGMAYLSDSEPVDVPGLGLSANFLWGTDPYEHPKDLPKVAASGGPRCEGLPVGYQEKPPFVVADVGSNPFAGDREGLELNVDSLQRALFGPIMDGRVR
ncbi:MCE family protein [Williamsia sp.]|uniref:MCE family protein n=1 Tax=Williamsia sp. TaxID=1872085 RepID=UPI002F95D210